MKTKIFVLLPLLIMAGLGLNAQSLLPVAGSWDGSIAIAGIELPIEVDIVEAPELSASISIPSQGLKNGTLNILSHTETELSFMLTVPGANALFRGSREGDRLFGSFEQAGMTGTFSLDRQGDSRSVPPVEQYLPEGVDEEELSLQTATGTLSGSLVMPNSRENLTVVLIVAGSGPTDRDGNSALLPGQNNSLRMLAVELAKHDIASLRYDKRGVGGSFAAMIEESRLRVSNYAEDAAAWTALLRADHRFSKVIVLGHSEGSMLAMLAAEQQCPDAFISLAGSGNKFQDLLRTQLLREGSVFDPEIVTFLLSEISAGRLVENVPAGLEAIFRPSVQPYLSSMFAVDPAQLIAELSIPILIVQGDTDIQVSVEDAQLLAAAQPEAQLCLIPGMNHVLKASSEDLAENMATYYMPNLPLAEGLIPRLVEFCHSISASE